MNEPLLDISDDFVSLFSDDSIDPALFIAFRFHSNELIAQIGRKTMTIPPNIAARFALKISSLAQKVIESAAFQAKVDQGYFDWTGEE